MLIRLISSVRKKPKHVRDQFAFWTAIIFTSLVVCFWVIGLPGRVNSNFVVEDEKSKGVFSSLFDEIGGQFSEATENISSATPDTTPGSAPDLASSTSPVQIDMEATLLVEPASASVVPRAIRIATTTASTTQ